MPKTRTITTMCLTLGVIGGLAGSYLTPLLGRWRDRHYEQGYEAGAATRQRLRAVR